MLKLGASHSKQRKCNTPKTVVRELKSKDLVKQTRAAREAHTMLREQNVSTTDMVNAGVIPPLIKALGRHDCSELQSEALSALTFVAFKTFGHTMAVVKSGVIPKLVAFLTQGSELIEQAVLALGNFALHSQDIRNAALASKAVPAMLPYLTPDTPIRQLRSIMRAYSLLCSHDNEQTNFNLELLSPALPHIFELLAIKDEEPTEIEDGKSLETEDIEYLPSASDVVGDACTALTNIMHGPDESIEAVQAVAGLTARLVGLLGHEATNVREAALSAVGNMLAGTHNQVDRCLDANCLEHIMSLLQCSEPSLVKEAARVTGYILAGTRAQIQRALGKGILTPLRSILASTDPEFRKQAMYAVTCLCDNGSAAQHEQLVSSGVLEPYCALLAGPDRAVVVEVLDSLDVLLQNAKRYGDLKPLCYKLDELDVLDQIQQLQEHETDEEYRSKITKIDKTLHKYAREERSIVLEGKTFTLAQIVQDLSSQDLATKTQAARAVHCFLCEENPPINAILEPGIIKPLVIALDGDLSSDLQLAAVQALSKTTSGTHKHRMALVDSGAVPKLISLLVRGDKVAELAACCLGDLALHGSETREAVLSCTRSETALTELRTYVRAYGNLCRQEPMVQLEYILRALPFVSELLYIEDKEVLETTCHAFSSLIYGTEHNSVEAVQAVPGLTARLVDLLAHKTSKVQEAALMVVCNMLSGTDAQVDRCLEAGCLVHVISFLQSTEPTMVELAAATVSNILHKHSHIQRALEEGILTPLRNILDLRFIAVSVGVAHHWHVQKEYLGTSEGKTLTVLTLTNIVQGLNSKELETQTTSALAAYHMLCKQDSARTAAIEAGIIVPLVEALGRDDRYALQLLAVYVVLAIVDGKHKHRVALVNGGAIPKLVTLLSKSKAIAILAAEVLGRITRRSTETRDLVLTKGAVQAMLLHMRPDAPLELLRMCVQAFLEWCRIPIVSSSMVELMLPVLPYICKLLEIGDQDVLANACGAVANFICTDERIYAVQAVEGLTERIVNLLGHEANQVKEAALGAVSNMCIGTDLQANRCLDAGCLEHIVPILQQYEPERALPHLSLHAVEKAVAATSNLLRHTPSQIQRALEKGILTPLLNVLTDSEPNSRLEFNAVCALRSIAKRGTREHKMVIVEAGAISMVVPILSHEAAVVEQAALVLGHIVNEIPETSDLVLGEGAVQAMLPHMLPDTPLELLRTCIWTYQCLCLAKVSVPNMSLIDTVLPALPYITKLLDIEDTIVLKLICGSLFGLMNDSYERTEAVQATPGLTARVVSLLGHQDTDVKAAALDTVMNMLIGTEIQVTRCLDADCLDHFLSLLQSNEPSLVEQTVWLTSKILSQSPSQIQRVLKKGMLTPLLHILAVPKPKSPLQQHAIKVFFHITKQGTREQIMDVVQSGAIPTLVTLLPHGADEAQMAIGILANIAHELPETCQEMLDLEVVPAMLPFLHASTPSALLTNCVETFRIFCRHDDKKPSDMLQRVSPALPAVSELLTIGDTDVVRRACSALVELMKTNEGIEAVQAVAGLTARLLALLGHEATEVKEVSMSALMLMLTGTDAQVDHCFDANCVDHMTWYLRCRDPSLMEQAAEATRSTLDVTHRQLQRALDEDVLTPFMRILTCPPKGQKRTVKAITNLCRRGSAAQREQLMSSGVLEPYCALLAGPDRAVVVEVLDSLDVLLQVAENDDKVERLRMKLVQMGVRNQILLLQQHGGEEVKEKADLLINVYFPSGSYDAQCCSIS